MPSTAVTLRFFYSGRWLFTALLLSLLTVLPARAQARDLVLGFVVGECQLFYTTEQAEDFADYLSGHLGRPVRIRTFKDQDKLHQWMNRFREVDLAVFSRDYLDEKGNGSFIPLSEFILESSGELGKGMVVGRRGLTSVVFVKVKQCLLAAAADSNAADLLNSLEVADFVIPRQPQADYSRVLPQPRKAPVPGTARQLSPSPQNPVVVPRPSVQPVPPVQASGQGVQLEVLSPKDDGVTGSRPMLQYYLSNAKANIYLDGELVNKGPGDRLGPLVDGRHELVFELRSPVQSPQKRTIRFRVDATPPDLVIDQPQRAVSTTAAIVRGEREADAGIRILDAKGRPTGNVVYSDELSWTASLFRLQPGVNRFQVVARDRYGNEQRQPLVITLDVAPLPVTIVTPADGSIVTDTPSLSFSADGGEVRVLVDGEEVENVSRALDGLDEGSHQVVVQVRDEAGKFGEAISRFQIDRSGPEMSVDPVPEVVNQRQATLSGSREANSLLTLTSEPESIQAELLYPDETSWQVRLDQLVEGENVISLLARDTAGNSTVEEIRLSVDTTVPAVTVSSPVQGQVYAESPRLDYQAETESVRILLDGSEPALSADAQLPELAEGPHSLVISVSDAAGNIGQAQVDFVIDRSPPEIELVSPPAGLSNNPQPVLDIVGEGDYSLFLDEQPLQAVSGDRLGPLTDGEHRLRLKAIDAAGNRLEIERLLLVDTTPPVWEVLSGQAPGSSTERELAGRRESGSELSISADSARVVAVDYPTEESWKASIADLSEGQNRIQITATDAAGNSLSGHVILLLDSRPPELTLDSPQDETAYSHLPVLSYRVIEGDVRLRLDGQDLALENGMVLPEMSDGHHQLEVVVTDQAGNVDRKVVAFTLDRELPEVAVTQPAPRVSTSQPVLSFVTSEGTVQILLDGSVIEIASGEPLPLLDDGNHLLQLTATDAAGNVGTAELAFLVDTTLPSLLLDAVPDEVTGEEVTLEGDADPEAELVATLEGREIPVERLEGGRWRLVAGELQSGSNQLQVVATDPGGLVAELRVEIVRDSRPPELVVASPQAGQVYGSSPQLDFSISDGQVEIQLDSQQLEASSGDSLPPLTDGEHRVDVIVTDTAGNSTRQSVDFVIDQQGPSLEVNPLPAAFKGEFLVIEGRSEPGAELSVVDQQGAEACQVAVKDSGDWSCVVGPFEEGPLEFTVTAADKAGNVSPLVVRTVVDRSPPVLEWRSPLPGVYPGLAPIDYTLSDGRLELTIDGQRHDPGSPVPELADGVHRLDILAVDEAGNETSQSISLTIDRQPPLVVISQPEHLVVDAQPVVSFVADEAELSIFLDDELIAISAGDKLPTLVDGEHRLRIEARDAAGNLGVEERVFRVDTTRPELVLSSQPGPVAGEEVLLQGTVEADALVTAEFAGQALPVRRPLPENWELPVSGLKEGTNQVVVLATDPGGLQTALNIQVVRDVNPPSLFLLSPQEQTYGTDRVILEYQLDTSSEGLEIELDGDLISLGEDRLLGPLSEGEHRLVLRARDAAGNLASIERVFSVDVTPPDFTIELPPEVLSGSTFRLSGTREPGSLVDVLPPEGVQVSTPHYPAETLWEVELSHLTDGEHGFSITARDPSGNVAEQQLTVKVDSMAPVVRILSPVAGTMNDPRPLLEVEGEGGALSILLNGREIDPQTTRLGPLEDGDYSLLVTETDSAGNVGDVEVVFKVDTTAPFLELVSPIDGERTSTTPSLVYEVDEGEVQVQLDGRAIDISSGQNLPQLTSGEHQLHLTATDLLGNVVTASVNFTVDGRAPQVNLISPASGLTPDNTPLLQFRADRGEVRVLVDGKEVDKRSGMSLDPLAEGEHLIRVEAVDKVGNVGFAERRLVISSATPVYVSGTSLDDRFSDFSIDIDPEVVSADFSGDIALRIGPLRKPGETVYVEQWIDSNGNGVADSGEQVARVFKLVDGLSSPSSKVPGDSDGQADRMILLNLSLEQLHRSGTGTVQYVLLAIGASDVAEATFKVTSSP